MKTNKLLVSWNTWHLWERVGTNSYGGEYTYLYLVHELSGFADYPIVHEHLGKVVYDRPEAVPQYIQRRMVAHLVGGVR